MNTAECALPCRRPAWRHVFKEKKMRWRPKTISNKWTTWCYVYNIAAESIGMIWHTARACHVLQRRHRLATNSVDDACLVPWYQLSKMTHRRTPCNDILIMFMTSTNYRIFWIQTYWDQISNHRMIRLERYVYQTGGSKHSADQQMIENLYK